MTGILHTITTFEAFAHCLRGVTATFFFFWCYWLHPYRNRLWMARLFYLAMLYVACCYVKDGLLMVEGWKDSPFLGDLITVIDLPFVPITCAFFIEVCHPGWVTPRRALLAFLLQALFIPAYLLHPAGAVCLWAYTMAFTMVVLTFGIVVGHSVWYRQRHRQPFLYPKFFQLKWLVGFCLLFVSTVVIYYTCFDQATWGSEVLFNALSLLLWSFPFRYTLQVLQTLQLDRPDDAPTDPPQEEDADAAEPEGPADNGLLTQEQLAEIGALLTKSMEQDKVYLDPKLSLTQLAYHTHQNRTYMSYYLNRCLGMTFYEYLNRYRVEESCARIDALSVTDRKPLTEIASECGFNSFSTFSRAFSKYKGITPGDYVRKQQMNASLQQRGGVEKEEHRRS